MLDTTNSTPAGADQPQSQDATTRRTLGFTGMAAVLAGLISVAPLQPAAAANDPDVDGSDLLLVQLCARIVADRKELSSLGDWMLDLLPDDPDHDMVERRIQELNDETCHLAGRVAQLPALTPEGVHARAAAIKAMMPVDFGVNDMVPINWHRGMLDALLRDIAGRA